MNKAILKSNFSKRHFLYGVGGFGVLLLGLVILTVLNSAKGISLYESRLASRNILIDTSDISQNQMQTRLPQDDVAAIIEQPPQQTEAERQVVPTGPEFYESGLRRAPLESITEQSPYGTIPVKDAKNNLNVFEVYKKPFDLSVLGDMPRIAIIVEDVGISYIASESALRSLPQNITIAMSPYAPDLAVWMDLARKAGYETWLTMPLESADYPHNDPGPHTLLINAPERDNRTKLGWLMARPQGYAGFISSYNQIFTGASNDMRPIFAEMFNRGIAFVDNTHSAAVLAETIAIGNNTPYGSVDVWIDRPSARPQDIQAQLETLENIAREKGTAIGIIQSLPSSFQEIISWNKTLSSKNVALVPLSAAISK